MVFVDGVVKIEAYGFGICLSTTLLPGESPGDAADRLVCEEDSKRKALHNSWLRRKMLLKTNSLLSDLKKSSEKNLQKFYPSLSK